MTNLNHWRQLADQGDAEAQYMVGFMYETGVGVERDYAEAFFWYWLAATKTAMARAQPLGKRLTHEQVKEAQERTKEWRPTPGPLP